MHLYVVTDLNNNSDILEKHWKVLDIVEKLAGSNFGWLESKAWLNIETTFHFLIVWIEVDHW